MSSSAVAEMLAEQGIDAAAEARLNALAFTTEASTLGAMLDSAGDAGFARLVMSLVQDSGRAAEVVSTAVRPHVSHVRYLSPPSCSRCAVLAGRVYRYSEGFQRHPHCDCIMVPVTDASADLTQDPYDLAKRGLVTGLSKADMQAVADGADFNKIVNVRSRKAGLMDAGRVLGRRGRPTPEGIYRMTSGRAEAVDLLRKFGYVI